MLEFFGKLFRSIIFIAMGALVGWYDFEIGGIVAVSTSLFFAAIGGMLVHTWLSPRKKEYVPRLETQSLNEPSTNVNAAGNAGGTASVETLPSRKMI